MCPKKTKKVSRPDRAYYSTNWRQSKYNLVIDLQRFIIISIYFFSSFWLLSSSESTGFFGVVVVSSESKNVGGSSHDHLCIVLHWMQRVCCCYWAYLPISMNINIIFCYLTYSYGYKRVESKCLGRIRDGLTIVNENSIVTLSALIVCFKELWIKYLK